MQTAIKTAQNTEKGKRKMPKQFDEPVRADLVKRAVLAVNASLRQPYGADPEAGKRASINLSRRRHNFRGIYGSGMSRTPRKSMSGKGKRINWVGAFAPNTVGGRRAHPPKAEKIWTQKINIKERRKAIRSALAATMDKKLVMEQGHRIPSDYPFIIETSFESVDKTKNVEEILRKIGFADDLDRTSEKTVRVGKGKSRGRPYKKKEGVLIVVSGPCKLSLAARNIPGVDIVPIKRINAKVLAHGVNPGRATLFTEASLEKLEKEKLFM